MNVRHSRLARLVALTVVVSMPLLGMAGVASAKVHQAKHHHHKGGSGGSTGGGTGGPPALITVAVSPNPLVETGQSEVHAVIEVETSPSFAGDEVNIDSSQLSASCLGGVLYTTIQNGNNQFSPNRISVVLDDDGNVTVTVAAVDCAPGTSVVEADLEVAPFYTALTTLVALPPAVTPVGVTGYPEVGGVAQEVETGDTSTSGDSDVYAVFYVEDNPVYAEQTVEISSSQLESRCIRGWWWTGGNFPNPLTIHGVGPNTGTPIRTILDDDGNAVFAFKGISCAAGPSQVIADVLAGTHDTFVTTFTVLPPAPTI
ncbi:MAG TPA: hypothetical protein VNC61_00395 [Acidimicrobiales bacterium]|nr:hypothetical protein [Acidimicrobiales bacterium]